jgi:hypothetical protein
MKCQRTTLYLFRKRERVMWVKTSDGPDLHPMGVDRGFMSHMMQDKETIVCNDVQRHRFYNPEMDTLLGVKTFNFILVPILDAHKNVIGAIEASNKVQWDARSKQYVLNEGGFAVSEQVVCSFIACELGSNAKKAKVEEYIRMQTSPYQAKWAKIKDAFAKGDHTLLDEDD